MKKKKLVNVQNQYKGNVIRVIDGDTFEVLIDLGFGVSQKFSVRLDGIDTPEKNTKEGVLAKEYVRQLIEGKTVLLRDAGTEKYGRARASVSTEDGKDLAEFLIENNIGVEYHGEKKTALAELKLI